MKLIKFLVIASVFTFLSCEKSENLDLHLYDTWDLEWKQCGIYQNYYQAKINFTQTDSIDFGWFKQQGFDTVYFDTIQIIDNSTVQIISSDSTWDGNIKVNEFQKGRLMLERSIPGCENEAFRFE